MTSDVITPDFVKSFEEYVYGKNEFPKRSLIVVRKKGDATPFPRSHLEMEDVVLSSDTEDEPENEDTAKESSSEDSESESESDDESSKDGESEYTRCWVHRLLRMRLSLESKI